MSGLNPIAWIIAFVLGFLPVQVPQDAIPLPGAAVPILKAQQGGTNIGSVTAGNIGNCLKVSTASPFVWAVGTCGSGGGGSSGGTWATSTSQVSGQLVNYPNNTTDVVVIGATATTSANYYIDPNINYAFLKNASTTNFSVASTAWLNGAIKQLDSSLFNQIYSTTEFGNTLFGATGTVTYSTSVNKIFSISPYSFCNLTTDIFPSTNTTTVQIIFPDNPSTSAQCGNLAVGEWGLANFENESDFPITLSTTTNTNITFRQVGNTPYASQAYPVQLPPHSSTHGMPIQTSLTTTVFQLFTSQNYGTANASTTAISVVGSATNPTTGIAIPSDNFTISAVPVRFVEPDMSNAENSKGGIIEWGGYMPSGTYFYGSTTESYYTANNSTFNIASSKYNKWAWINAHYNSPASTGEGIHQHLTFETVQADWTTAVTRLSISFGEDTARVEFPNSNVRVFNDKYLQIGTDALGLQLKHDTALARMVASTTLPFEFASTTGLRIGSRGAPAGLLHLTRTTDAVAAKFQSFLGTANGSALALFESGAAGGIAIQSLVTGDTVNRFSQNTSGAMQWGPGGATARDVGLSRSSANVLAVGTGASGNTGGGLITSSSTIFSLMVMTGTTTNATSTNLSVSNNASTTNLWISGTQGGLLATDMVGKVVATTTLGYSLFPASGVSAGSYTNSNITVNSLGFITSASNGSGGSALSYIPWGGFATTSNFATSTIASTTAPWFVTGFFASSTSQFVSASSSALSASSEIFTAKASTTALIISGLQGKLLSTDSSGNVVGTTTIGLCSLAPCTISGITLGNNLAALTTSGTLSGTSYNGSSAISDWSINLSNANTWLGLQKFSGAGTTTIANGLEVGTKIAAPYFIATSTATSTAAGGWNLTGGCFAINGACIGSGGAGNPAGSGSELQFRDGASFGAVLPSSFDKLEGDMMFGTSSVAGVQNFGLATFGSSTEPQLVLTDNNPANPLWTFRAAGPSLTIATSTFSATTSSSNVFVLGQNGALCVGMGCTTPSASGLFIRDQDGTGPALFMGGNDGGDTDWKFMRAANNNSASDDPLTLGTVTTQSGVPTPFLVFQATGAASMSTSTPKLGVLTIGSTSPQLLLTDNNSANFLWSMRSIANSFYLATSTALATSSSAAIAINPNGNTTFAMPIAVSNTGTSTFASNMTIGTTTNNMPTTLGGGAALFVSNAINSLAGIFVRTWTNVANAFTVVNAAGTTVFNIDDSVVGGTTSGIGSTTLPGTPFMAKLVIASTWGDTIPNMIFVSSSTPSATSTLFSVTGMGHQIASSTNPVVTCTGGGITSFVGDDTHGEGVCGAGSTAMIVTFQQPWSNVPICTVSNQTVSLTSAMSYTITATALTISQAVGLAGDKIDFICQGVKGPN